jgi:glutamate racemase
VIPLIEKIVGPQVRVIDPAPAVARQVGRLLDSHNLHAFSANSGQMRFLTTGDPGLMIELLPKLIGQLSPVDPVYWDAGRLSLEI